MSIYTGSPEMSRKRNEQLTRKQVRNGVRIGAYCVGFNSLGYVIVHDTRGMVGSAHQDLEAAKAEMRQIVEQEAKQRAEDAEWYDDAAWDKAIRAAYAKRQGR